MNENRIELWSDRSGIYATYKGPHSAEIRRLFGSVCLPLPDEPGTRLEHVANRLRHTYPKVDIVIA